MNLSLRLLFLYEAVSLDSKYVSNPDAMKMIKDEIATMAWEIKQSEKGVRSGYLDSSKESGKDHVNTSTNSTFPSYLQDIFNGSGTSKKFLDAAKMGKGIVWTRIAMEAIDRLENGYKNNHGYDRPSKEFIELVNDYEQVA